MVFLWRTVQPHFPTILNIRRTVACAAMDLLQKDLCTYCNSIDFKTLPSEDEPGVPHQPNLEALKASADICQLCHLLLKAVNIIRDDIRGEHTGRLPKTAGLFVHAPHRGIVYCGRHGHGSYLQARPTSETPKPSSRPIAFAKDTSVQPWLFGNWWKRAEVDSEDDDESELQLIGLGIRLSRTPETDDVKTRRGVHRYRGTYLRIRTDSSMFVAALVPTFST